MSMNAQLNTMIRMALADLGMDAQRKLPRDTDQLRRIYQMLEVKQAFTPSSKLKRDVKEAIIAKNRDHLESATRALHLTEQSDLQLQATLKSHKEIDLFASAIIVGAVYEEMARRVVEEMLK